MMLDQITIGRKSSYDNFGASISARRISDPEKKKITKTVPFSNLTYDFTKINGEIYWGQRELEYEFEMMADTPEELEEMKRKFSEFVMNTIDENLYDPFIPNYHFIATYESKSFEDDESVEKTTAFVKFLAYPYKVANMPCVYKRTIAAASNATLTVINNSSHRITPTITITGEVRIVRGDSSYAFADATITDGTFALAVGANSFYVEENTGKNSCSIEISFYEEVF